MTASEQRSRDQMLRGAPLGRRRNVSLKGCPQCAHDDPPATRSGPRRAPLPGALALTGCSGAGEDSAGSSATGNALRTEPQRRRERGRPCGAGSGARPHRPAEAPHEPHSRTGRPLTVQVKDVPKALEARAGTESAGGYVGNETTTRDGEGHERTRVVPSPSRSTTRSSPSWRRGKSHSQRQGGGRHRPGRGRGEPGSSRSAAGSAS
ncbi:hypothetical protein SAFG77S_08174 [Streptomyces afghaniensis]